MRKKLLTLAAFGLTTLAAQAQWINQPVGFSNSALVVTHVNAVSSGVAWAMALDPLGTAAGTARTIDGTTWTPGAGPALSTGETLTYLSAVDANLAWVTTYNTASGGSRILKTTDGGTIWAAQTGGSPFANPDSYANFVHFFNANEGVAVGDPDGTTPSFEIYTTANGGTTWTRLSSLPAALTDELGATTIIGSTIRPAVVGDNVWFATDAGRIYHSANRGQTWTVSSSGASGDISSLSFSTVSNGLLVAPDATGSSYELRRTTDGGTTWAAVTYTGPLHAAAIDNIPGISGGYMTAGFSLPLLGLNDGGSSYTTNNGASWISLETTFNHTSLDMLSNASGWSGSVNPNTLGGNGVNKFSVFIQSTRRDAALQQALSVYPNPSHDGVFTLDLATSLPQATELRVTDALGREVYRTALRATSGRAGSTPLDLRQQKAGLYTLELRSDTGVAQQKLVIQ
ncbi:T9SS type A sorting domain-containing protein [Hymenobacter jeollabukensis]|uniref:T9SS type A sorting domain-containing protein n=1 Tax=Hymenobacter jeollabukensis TaxID=2025313 RepID=A0A5R8WXK7_9BACT|nr:T9SS type A sorting domain-containing protein [Hymenobacter jeollabukensis]TLM96793.1 T9SS type A sorting domain-containing protein [Hymenobacter jeollabukensis]